MITFAMFYWYESLYYKEIPSIYWMTLAHYFYLQTNSNWTVESLDKFTVLLGIGCLFAWVALLRYFKFNYKFHVSYILALLRQNLSSGFRQSKTQTNLISYRD